MHSAAGDGGRLDGGERRMLGDVSVLDDEFPSVLRVLTAVAAAHAPTLAAWAGRR